MVLAGDEAVGVGGEPPPAAGATQYAYPSQKPERQSSETVGFQLMKSACETSHWDSMAEQESPAGK